MELGSGQLEGQEIAALVAMVAGEDSAALFRPWVSLVIVLPVLFLIVRDNSLRNHLELAVAGVLIGGGLYLRSGHYRSIHPGVGLFPGAGFHYPG